MICSYTESQIYRNGYQKALLDVKNWFERHSWILKMLRMYNKKYVEMKAWYDDIDTATLQRIKTYSAFNDAESKNLMIQTIYEYREQQLIKAKKIIEELSKSLFLAKGIVRDLIDDTVDFKESKERAVYCYERGSFDDYREAMSFLKEKEIGYFSYYAGFLAGLEAGKPNWHKVADGDLPKDNMPYIVKVKLNYRGAPNISYWIKDNLHDDFEKHKNYTEDIIAWCEIPKYEKEEI